MRGDSRPTRQDPDALVVLDSRSMKVGLEDIAVVAHRRPPEVRGSDSQVQSRCCSCSEYSPKFGEANFRRCQLSRWGRGACSLIGGYSWSLAGRLQGAGAVSDLSPVVNSNGGVASKAPGAARTRDAADAAEVDGERRRSGFQSARFRGSACLCINLCLQCLCLFSCPRSSQLRHETQRPEDVVMGENVQKKRAAQKLPMSTFTRDGLCAPNSRREIAPRSGRPMIQYQPAGPSDCFLGADRSRYQRSASLRHRLSNLPIVFHRAGQADIV